MADKKAIEALTFEERVFPPSDEFVAQANVGPEIYEEAEKDWLGFWQKWRPVTCPGRQKNWMSWPKETSPMMCSSTYSSRISPFPTPRP